MRYWVRHDQPALPGPICYGWLDVPLAVAPDITAQALRSVIPSALPVFSSPLQRCRLLAEHLQEQPTILDDLREVHFGDWEGELWDDIPRDLLDAWAQTPYEFQFPNGEAVPQFLARVGAVIDTLPEACIVVTHAGVIRAALHHRKGLALQEAFATPIPFGSYLKF
ncbi:histidine phosphatase family protein [Salinispirillum sp. LH 10-3-1]|uniref:Histidine phosphatase family protein n=1 Tax=Salinispirillum sp. LH 10-3-1 TaxID=2952525 RepID=A0AB38YHR6_9GAMM